MSRKWLFKLVLCSFIQLVILTTIFSCNVSSKGKSETISEVIIDSIYLKSLHKKTAYRVYLPKIKDDTSKVPILYLLHGHGGSDNDWFSHNEGNVKHLLDSLISEKKIPELIAVTIDAGNSWYVNSKIQMETAYIDEFMPYIESKYCQKNLPIDRYIAGNSAGGYGSLNFALKYPELFKSAILLSPAAYYPTPTGISSSRKIDVFAMDGVFNDSIWQSYSYINIYKENDIKKYPSFYLSTGDHDTYDIFNVVSQLRNFFIDNNINVEVTIIDGDHTWDVWQNRFVNDLIRIFDE